MLQSKHQIRSQATLIYIINTWFTNLNAYLLSIVSTHDNSVFRPIPMRSVSSTLTCVVFGRSHDEISHKYLIPCINMQKFSIFFCAVHMEHMYMESSMWFEREWDYVFPPTSIHNSIFHTIIKGKKIIMIEVSLLSRNRGYDIGRLVGVGIRQSKESCLKQLSGPISDDDVLAVNNRIPNKFMEPPYLFFEFVFHKIDFLFHKIDFQQQIDIDQLTNTIAIWSRSKSKNKQCKENRRKGIMWFGHRNA